MKEHQNLRFILDTSFFRSIYDTGGIKELTFIIGVIKDVDLPVIILSTVLHEYSKTASIIKQSFPIIISDKDLDIKQIQEMNRKLEPRAFSLDEVGDLKFLAMAMKEYKQGRASIIVSNDEGFRTFLAKYGNTFNISVTLVRDFLRYISRYAVSETDQKRVKALANRINRSYSHYRFSQRRSQVQENAIEKFLSFNAISLENKTLKRLEQALQEYLVSEEIDFSDKDKFPQEYKVFFTGIQKFHEHMLTGSFQKALLEIHQAFQQGLKKTAPQWKGTLYQITTIFLIQLYKKMAYVLDEYGYWKESVRLFEHAILSNYYLGEKPEKTELMLLNIINLLTQNETSLEVVFLGIDEFKMRIINQLASDELQFLRAILYQVNNKDLLEYVNALLNQKSLGSVPQKFRKSALNQEVGVSVKFPLQTPFDTPIMVKKVLSNSSMKEVIIHTFMGDIKVQYRISNDDLNMVFKEGDILILHRGLIKQIKNPSPTEKEYSLTIIFDSYPEIEKVQKQSLITFSQYLLDHYVVKHR